MKDKTLVLLGFSDKFDFTHPIIDTDPVRKHSNNIKFSVFLLTEFQRFTLLHCFRHTRYQYFFHR